MKQAGSYKSIDTDNVKQKPGDKVAFNLSCFTIFFLN